jgi:TolB-like protein/Flp pilus assembly protein TadD
MGEVYRAHDERLQRTVAIKVLPPHHASPDRLDRFEQEARAASALNHPNILTIHDVGREGDTAWFAMEFVEGQTLRDLLRIGPIPLKRAVDLARQVADGLAKAHTSGIVHRDLKPENVMLTGDGLAKIVDFGIAKARIVDADATAGRDSTMTELAGTSPGVVVGTIGYMSPEQASGRPVDYRADQFALGLLIYELVTRTRPFDRPTTAQSMAATIEAEPPPIQSLNPQVPPHLAAIVSRLLAKDPAERYESTRDLAKDLGTVVDELSRPTSSEPSGAAAEAIRRRAATTRLGVAIAAFIVVAAGLWMWRSNRATLPDTEEQQRPLIAVRAFSSLSPDAQQGYFAAGITEEIRGQLSQVAALRVLSRTGLDSYRDDPARAVRELGVRNFVDGTVRVEGDRVRVSAELVDAASNETRWSQQYDRQLADVLAVQTEIAQQITQALHTNLSPSEKAVLAKRPTNNLDAYALYLKAASLPSADRARNLEAIDMLRKALALDPQFAAAQARIAYRFIFMGYYDDASNIDKGIAEAEAAIRLDRALAYAHFALGTAYGMKGMGPQSRQAFLRAIELDPNNSNAMNNLSITEVQYGRLEDALYWARRAFLRSGRRGNDYYHLTIPMLNLRADSETRVLLEEAERRSGSFYRVPMMLAMLELFEGRQPAAVARADALAEREPNNEEVRMFRADLAFLLDAPDLETRLAALMERSGTSHLFVAESVRLRYAYALKRRGDAARAAELIGEAQRLAREKIDAGSDHPVLRVELAAAAALRGDSRSALEWLRRAVDGGYRDDGFLERDPILKRQLGSDRGFKDLLEEIRSDVAAQRERARARGLLELQPLQAGS